MPLPFLLVGDHPSLPSGLGRILRDLAQQMADDPSLDLDVRVCGCRPGGMGQDGFPGGREDIPVWSFLASDMQAQQIAEQVALAWLTWWGDEPGVVLGIWDAARLYALAHSDGPWDLWGYVPVDAEQLGGGYVGPIAATVARLQRVLGYGRWGATVLRSARQDRVPFLPHGITDDWLIAPMDVERQPNLVGCVMTNQPRKDWAVAFQTIAELRRRGHKVKFWAHTDRVYGAWDLPTLMGRLGLDRYTQITLADHTWTDARLMRAYRTCGVTFLPSLAEGFGYPIVESLASGGPCIHTTEAGGAELVPRSEWRAPRVATRIDGPMMLVRPVLNPIDFANAIERAWEWQARWPDKGAAYCRGSVAHLRWRHLWPRWASWIRQGLEARE